MPFLGCIADDFTGATDLGSMLVRGGMRCLQLLGVPHAGVELDGVDAVVISLKSRSIRADDAVRDSLAALEYLQSAGCSRFFFKYCSTFDSTDQGNIGPVSGALATALDAETVLFCPAFPENGRTVYQGHLFVGQSLLNESGMERHPLNPMTDANLVRVLGRQSEQKVGQLPLDVVSQGAGKIRDWLQHSTSFVVADAVCPENLESLASAVRDAALVTGGSAIAKHLALAYAEAGLIDETDQAAELPPVDGPSAVLAGSCSGQTLKQVADFARHYPVVRLDPFSLENPDSAARDVLAEVGPHLGERPVMVASSMEPDQLLRAKQELGADVSAKVEDAMAQIAEGLVEQGVRRLVVAGGETSGAVLSCLCIAGLRIGSEIDPGVPWTQSIGEPRMAFALKSGNFGGDEFFRRALSMSS